jgi:hypothetical protein
VDPETTTHELNKTMDKHSKFDLMQANNQGVDVDGVILITKALST